MKKPRVDRLLFVAASSAAIAASVPLGLFPDQAGPFISELYNWIASNVGVLYQIFGFGVIGFLLLRTDPPTTYAHNKVLNIQCLGNRLNMFKTNGFKSIACPYMILL